MKKVSCQLFVLLLTAKIYAMEQKPQISAFEQTFLDKALRISSWFGAGITKSWLERGADVNCVDGDGMTLLMWAASEGNMNLVTTLLHAGANVEAQDNDGLTALWYAFRQPTCMMWSPHVNLEIFTLLCNKHKANINHRRKEDGDTMLLFCAKENFAGTSFIATLLGLGADVTMVDNRGRDVWHYAQKAYERECNANVYLDAGSPFSSYQDRLQIKRDEAYLKQCFIQERLTALNAIKKKFVERACALLKCDGKSRQANTILNRFCAAGDVANVQILLNAGADPNMADAKGMTPLMHAVYAPDAQGCTGVVQLLKQRGAKLDATDKQHWTAKTHAIHVNNQLILEFLQ